MMGTWRMRRTHAGGQRRGGRAASVVFETLFEEIAEDPTGRAAQKALSQLGDAHRRARRLLDQGAPRYGGPPLKKTVAALAAAQDLLRRASGGV